MLPSKLDEFDRLGEMHWSKNGNPRRKVYADQNKGVIVQDIWLDFPDAINQNTIITNYPTEKNMELLRRIITASSDPNDLVLDCFSGSGTTLSAANELQRNWVGIDCGKLAIDITLKRMKGQIKGDPHFGKPASFTLYKI
jgi:adenine-specific DNA-methyltransferase